LEVYDINSNQITGAAFMGTVGLDWQIIGTGNFSSMPGETDLMMRNTKTGGNTAFPLLAFIAKSAVLPNGIILGLASPLSP
jgi:hypothetical protein